MIPKWLEWGRRLQATAQSGLAYTQNPFDIERYHAIAEIAAEIIAAGSGEPLERLNALFGSQEGYTTPKIDVRGALFQDDRLLLVPELLDGGRWTLPGGWADAWESPSRSVEREMVEESGFEVKAFHLAAVYDRALHGHPPYYFSSYKLFFLCERTGGEARASIETGLARFFAEDQLPELSISRTTDEEIAMLFRHHRDPSLPTEFD